MKDIDEFVEELKSCHNEEESIDALKRIIKNFNIIFYEEMLESNPYFKSLFLDVREDVVKDMENMINNLNIEVINLEEGLKDLTDLEPIMEIRVLKRKCEFLISELNNRKLDLIGFKI